MRSCFQKSSATNSPRNDSPTGRKVDLAQHLSIITAVSLIGYHAQKQ